MSSANQRPADDSYPYWLANGYSSPVRARRINERLAELKDITPDDFRKLQLDTKHLRAQALLPVLLALIEPESLWSRYSGGLPGTSETGTVSRMPTEIAPTIFHVVGKALPGDLGR